MRNTILFIFCWTLFLLPCFSQQSDFASIPLGSSNLNDLPSIINFNKNIEAAKDTLSAEALIQLYTKGLTASQEIQNDTLAQRFADKIGIRYYIDSDLTNARKYSSIALDHSRRSGDNSSICRQLITLGCIDLEENNVVDAIDFLLEVVELSKKDSDAKRYESFAYLNISYGFYILGEYKQSISYLRLAEILHKNSIQADKNIYLANVYDGIAGCYMELENRDSANFYVNQIVLHLQKVESDTTTFKDISYEQMITNNYIDIIDFYLWEDNIEKAKIYNKKLSSFKAFNKDKKYISDINFAVKVGDLNKAKELIDTYSPSQNITFQLDFLKYSFEYYKKIGDFEKGFSLLEQYNDRKIKELESQKINLSTYSNEKIEKINQQQEIEKLKQEKAYQSKLSNLSLTILSLLAISFFLLLYSFFQMRTKNKLLNKNMKDEKTIQLQMQKLQQVELQKNKLYTNIAHELQTPLNIIQGLSKKLFHSNNLTENESEAIQIINRNSTYLSDATNQILSVNLLDEKTNSSTNTLFCLFQLFDSLLPEFQFLAEEKSINLHYTNTINDLVKVYTDLDKVRTILKNILSNAIKYTPDKGEISIKYLTVKEEYHNIIIQDNGKGIAENQLPNIFDRYYQSSDKAEGGFGIGLAICQEYIKVLNGEINVTSTIGKGTSFSILIPKENLENLSADVELYSFPKNDYLKRKPLNKKIEKSVQDKNHLLIVEDNIDFCKYLKSVLENEYNLTFVHNGVEALEAIKNNIPTLIITDWMMREMDGLKFIEKLKLSEEYCHLPVLMLTARSLPSDKIKALRVGIDDYLIKPVDEDLLKSKIAYFINNKNQQGEGNSFFEFPIANYEGNEISQSNKDWLFEIEKIIFPLIHDFDLNLEQVAKLSLTNVGLLNRKIKSITGLTAKKYIQEIRYWEARRMLETREYDSVKAVCYSVGFKDQKNFSRKFKNRFGVNPSEYLKSSIS